METTELTGRALDAEIAQRVMGWEWLTFHGYSQMTGRSSLQSPEDVASLLEGPASFWRRGRSDWADLEASSVPHYSTDIAAAWLVVERMREIGYTTMIRLGSNDRRAWVTFVGRDWSEPTGEGLEDTLPLAVCRGALEAIERHRPERRPT